MSDPVPLSSLTDEEREWFVQVLDIMAATFMLAASQDDPQKQLALVRSHWRGKEVAVVTLQESDGDDITMTPLVVLVTPDMFDELQDPEADLVPAADAGPQMTGLLPAVDDYPYKTRCIVCGEGTVGEIVPYLHGRCNMAPDGAAIFHQHEMSDHSHCHPNACQAAATALQDG